MRCFLLNLLKFAGKDSFCHAFMIEAFYALMKGTSDDHTGYERCIDMLLTISGELQVYRYTGRKRDDKLSMTNDIYFQL